MKTIDYIVTKVIKKENRFLKNRILTYFFVKIFNKKLEFDFSKPEFYVNISYSVLHLRKLKIKLYYERKKKILIMFSV